MAAAVDGIVPADQLPLEKTTELPLLSIAAQNSGPEQETCTSSLPLSTSPAEVQELPSYV